MEGGTGGVPSVWRFNLQPSTLQLFSAYPGGEEHKSLEADSLTVSCRRRRFERFEPDPATLLRSYFFENSCSLIDGYSSAPHLERRKSQSVFLEAIPAGCKLNATRTWLGGVLDHCSTTFDHGMAAQRCDLGTPLPRVLVRFVCWTRQAFFPYMKIGKSRYFCAKSTKGWGK